MKTWKRRERGVDIRKATNFGMAVNAMEIGAMVLLLVLVLYGNHLTVTGGTRCWCSRRLWRSSWGRSSA